MSPECIIFNTATGDEILTGSVAERPMVTLAIFAYNQQDLILQALEAALDQTYTPLEILITDDCSTDSTVTKIEGFINTRGSERTVSLQRNSNNLGWTDFGRLINEAVARAQGELIVLAAGDDISRLDRVEKLVNAWVVADRPTCVIHSAFKTLSDSLEHDGHIRCEGRDFGDRTPLETVLHDGEGMLGATIAFTPDLFTKFGPLPDSTVFEDRVLGFRAILGGQVLYVDEALVQYRLHSANVSGPNIYADPERWNRFCRGLKAMYASFRTDYLTMYPEPGSDSCVLRAIERRNSLVRRKEKLLSGTVLQKALAAWQVTVHQQNWLYRALFTLKTLGLRKSKTEKNR